MYTRSDCALDDQFAALEARLVELRRKRRGKRINEHGWRWCLGCGGERVCAVGAYKHSVFCGACERTIIGAIVNMFDVRCWGCLGRFGEHVRADCPAVADAQRVAS